MENIIKRLSYDKAFGILTRPALELELEKIEEFNCCLIDINNLKSLNRLLGYGKINDIIYDIFDEFKKESNCFVGRWFNGDEILIVDKNIKQVVCLLDIIAKENGISFKTNYFKNVNLLKVGKLINKMK